MPQVDFYHLTRAPLEAVLPKLLEKILAGGGRALVVAQDAAVLARLDEQLWRYDPASFLPHAVAGGDNDADQPVLLSERPDAVNGARFLLVTDGQWPSDTEGFDRTFFLFDESGIANARNEWRRAGPERRYWKQDENGRWIEGP